MTRIVGESPAPFLPASADALPRAEREIETPRSGPSPFQHALRSLGGQIDQGEGLIANVNSPGVGQMDAGTLIALQVGIYRYSEALDLTAKLVDRASGAVKTVVQGSGH